MNQTINEIEGSQLGGAEAADNCASPYNLNELREIVGDIRLLANQYCITPTKCKVTRVMFVESLINMAKRVNGKLPLYIEDLKQNKVVEAFCISSGKYRDDMFWEQIDKICKEMEKEEVYQSLKENRNNLQILLAKAEEAVRNCNPEVFEKFFLTKKLDFSDAGVMKRFNLWLYENNTHSIETLRELRAQEVARALEMKVFDFTPIPSQRVVNEMSVELIKDFLPYGYEITDDFKVDYARFRRYAYRDGVVVKLNYKEYGKYIHHHYDDFGDDRLHAIFELDMMLFLINQEMERLNPELVKNPVAQPADNQPEAKEELFHFVHPSLDDEEGWKIHNEVKRLVKRQSIQEICLYLKGMAKEKKVLLPQMPSVAYAELVRMGMPSSDGFTESTFRKYYENK